MSNKNLLKAANAANARYIVAVRVMEESHEKREAELESALVFVSTVSDAIAIYRMTDRKEIERLAWIKAVLLLGSSSRDFEDLLLILHYPFPATQKEADISQHLSLKEGKILEHPTIDQVHRLYTLNQHHYFLRQRAKEMLKTLIKGCNELSELQRWHDAYGKNERGAEPFFDSWEYDRAVKRLQSAAEKE